MMILIIILIQVFIVLQQQLMLLITQGFILANYEFIMIVIMLYKRL